jgi:hypothetical protein
MDRPLQHIIDELQELLDELQEANDRAEGKSTKRTLGQRIDDVAAERE